MKQISYEELEFYMDNIAGVVAINMEGYITYVNPQCHEYFGMADQSIIGRHILEIFPKSTMIEGLKNDKPEMVFYSTYLGIGISIQVPLFKNGKKVGLLEYDATQGSQRLYELSREYSDFLDKELLHNDEDLPVSGDAKYSLNQLIGRSMPMISLKEEIMKAAQSNSTVIITGETGTGKELVASAIHNLSSRRRERLIKINSSAFPENLVESELFGYVEGAFTGAVKGGKKGKFELANKGTLFIDEINQMPMSVQPKLLRVLQEKEIDRIGSDVTIPIDVRIIAATNQDLEGLVAEGKFREDLFYRLNVYPIHIPPLRERLDDLELLMESKIKSLNVSLGKHITSIDPEVLHQFHRYNWPGNIRELYNKVERAMNYVSAEDDTLRLKDFRGSGSTVEPMDLNTFGQMENPIETVKNDAERKLIREVLQQVDGNKTKAAEYLKISRPLLYQKMKRLGIK